LNGRTWNALGTIHIIDNNQSGYQFTHPHLPTGNIYYRIKQTDNDGTFIYSKTVVLRNGAAVKNYFIYPNPSTDYFTVSMLSNISEDVSIELFDVAGRKLLTQYGTESNFRINSNLLPNGTYLLKIKQQENSFTEKIIIRHP
jgi:hypothetical protein